MLMDAPCLVPQAAVAAAAGAAALTAARLGASPDAVAGAVAAAVHSTWRWASPSAVQPHTSLPEECETDRVGVWFAHEGLGSAVQLEASDEPGGTAQLMDAQHRAPDEPGDEAQLMDPLFGRAAQFAGLEELGSAAQFEASDEPDNAVLHAALLFCLRLLPVSPPSAPLSMPARLRLLCWTRAMQCTSPG